MYRRFCVTLAAIVVVFAAVAWFGAINTAESSVTDYENMIADFFAKVEIGDYAGAIEFLYSNNPWITAKSDDIQQLRSQFVGLAEIVGEYKGRAIISQEKIADKIVYLNYLLAMERQPLSFKFFFYYIDGEWRTQSFAYNDDIEDMLEERARQQFYSASK